MPPVNEPCCASPKPLNRGSRNTRAPFLVEAWLLLCAGLGCTGWILSALHELNATGYAVALIVGGGGLLAWGRARVDFGRIRIRRFRSAFPLCFLALALLATLGGLLYSPNNYDGLTYRIPRVLNWLADAHWHWIHTNCVRQNLRGTGWEWLAAPLLAITGNYRWLFLVNAIPYFLMPGLVFSTFTRMGVRPRVAWFWMWLVPCGYCFVLQAASIGNDSLGALFALAAVDFALRAKVSRKVSDLWFSLLSAALLTGLKGVSNLPLLLPWAIAVLPVITLARKRVVATATVVLCATGASLLPISLADQRYGGDWMGLSTDGQPGSHCSPIFCLPANSALLLIQNFAPPVFPMADAWKSALDKRLPGKFVQRMKEQGFELYRSRYVLGQMEIEEDAGLGFGLSALLLFGIGASFFFRTQQPTRGGPGFRFYGICLILAPWVSLFVFVMKCTPVAEARLAAAYYPLLVPLALSARGQSGLVRARWWRRMALATFAIAMVLLIASPARPLWPAHGILEKLNAAHSSNRLLRRVNVVYSVYAGRADGFAPVRDILPRDVRVLGFISTDAPEASLWSPMGSRRIEHVTPGDRASDLRARGIDYILVNPNCFPKYFGKNFEQWQASLHAHTAQTIPLTLRAGLGSVDWILVQLTPKT